MLGVHVDDAFATKIELLVGSQGGNLGAAGDVQGELVCLGLLHHGIAGGERACKIISRDFV